MYGYSVSRLYVPGNEEVDLLAKQATGWRHKEDKGPRTPAQHLAWLPQLLSSCKRMINAASRARWHRKWEQGETGMLYKKRWQKDGVSLFRHTRDLYKNLSHKAEASVLIQLRTERIGLYGYLYKINRQDDPWCGCRQAYQTVKHIIEDCEALEQERLDYLGVDYVRDARVFLTDSELIPKIVAFILATGLLDQFAKYAKTFSPLE